jgi:hypothetical protein
VFDAGTDDLANFLRILDVGGNAVVTIDTTGGGDFSDPAGQVATLTGVSAGDLVRVYLDNTEHQVQTLT